MTAETTSTLPTGPYKIDPVHSSVSFKTRRGLGTFRAGFAGIEGGVEGGVLRGQVPVDGLILPTELFKEVLGGPEWFDGETHPIISWEMRSGSADGDKIRFVGDLTLKGTTKEITGIGEVYGPGKIPGPHGEVEMLGIDITADLNASDFGVGNGFLGDKTTIEISLTLMP
jgi:polyisoprenoid-binding protein YceI